MNDTNLSTTTNVSNTSLVISNSVALQYVFSGTLILCMIGGLFFNMLFIIIISKSRNFYRRSLFGLCLNLVCIFFLDIFFNQVITLVSTINNAWMFSDVICIAQAFCINLVDTCLSLTLFMLGIDRLIAINANVNDRINFAKGLNKDAIALCILCLWLLSICFSIPLVTKTINSTYSANNYGCFASISNNLIYRISLFVMTIGLPLLCVLAMYIHICKVWCSAKKEIIKVSLSYTLKQKFQIEKEVNNSICTFFFQFLWVVMLGPYFVGIYIQVIPSYMTVIFLWLRNFYCWIPFIVIVACHRSFRKKLTVLITGDKASPSSADVVPNSTLHDNSNESGTTNPNYPDHTYSTNLAFSDPDLRNNHETSYYDDSIYCNSSPSLSYTSSAVSTNRIEHLPKVPVMFATVSGVHVVNKYFAELSVSADNESRLPGTLCDVNEAGFTDTSDAASLTTDNSFKGNRIQNHDVKLPADITELYNPDGYKHKRLKRRPQSIFQNKASLESAFKLPRTSPQSQEETKPDESIVNTARKKKRPAPPIPITQLPKQCNAKVSFRSNTNIVNSAKNNANSLEMDAFDSKNA